MFVFLKTEILIRENVVIIMTTTLNQDGHQWNLPSKIYELVNLNHLL